MTSTQAFCPSSFMPALMVMPPAPMASVASSFCGCSLEMLPEPVSVIGLANTAAVD